MTRFRLNCVDLNTSEFFYTKNILIRAISYLPRPCPIDVLDGHNRTSTNKYLVRISWHVKIKRNAIKKIRLSIVNVSTFNDILVLFCMVCVPEYIKGLIIIDNKLAFKFFFTRTIRWKNTFSSDIIILGLIGF